MYIIIREKQTLTYLNVSSLDSELYQICVKRT